MFGTYRTFLALMVVALHLGGAPMAGVYAVFGFYVLSGYLMTFIMQNSYGYSLSGVLKYAINRILRIYPIYWISILFSAIMIFIVGESFSSNYHPVIYYPKNMIETLRNIFLFFPKREAPRLTPPAWSLTVEIFFYILIGVGLSKKKNLVSCWLIISILYHSILIFTKSGIEKKYFPISGASLPFATGAFVYHFKQEILRPISSIPDKVKEQLPSILFCAIISNWLIGFFFKNLDGIFFYTNYLLCVMMTVILSDRKRILFISKEFDTWMGNLSYPIYLIHYQIGLAVVLLLEKMGFMYKRPDLVIFFISIPLILITAWICTVTIEKPIDTIRGRIRAS